jgi:hypothetical protein
MRTARIALTSAVALGLLLFLPTVQAKKKHEASYNAQASYTFENAEPTAAHGLVIALSAPAEVVTDPSTGAAGPFGNVGGNGTSKITLTNPTSPIPGTAPADAPDEAESDEAESDAAEDTEAEEGAAVEAEADTADEAGSVHLVFRTFKKKIQIKSWWWLDERGKRLGAKQKG